MEEQLISFEVAVLAKAIGFDVVGNLMYATTGQHETYNKTKWTLYRDYCHAPTQSLLQTWLRRKKSIHVNVHEHIFNQYTFEFATLIDGAVHSWSYATFFDGKLFYDTYEDALEIGLKKALETFVD